MVSRRLDIYCFSASLEQGQNKSRGSFQAYRQAEPFAKDTISNSRLESHACFQVLTYPPPPPCAAIVRLFSRAMFTVATTSEVPESIWRSKSAVRSGCASKTGGPGTSGLYNCSRHRLAVLRQRISRHALQTNRPPWRPSSGDCHARLGRHKLPADPPHIAC